jgi:hypothetical protein
MAEDGTGLRNIPYVRLFPWVRLFRLFGVATDAKKLILAALGLVLVWAGWDVLDRIFPGSREITPAVAPPSPFLHQLFNIQQVATYADAVSDPIRMPARPFLAIFGLGQGALPFLHALAATLWVVLVWGVMGGAIARIAVLQVAVGEYVSLPTAVRFAVGKLRALVGAPLTPVIGVGFFATLCAVQGLLYWIPGDVGATIAGIFAFLPLLAGLVMALILVGLAAGWPLMVATVAAEGEDAFDALSRTYSYVFQRPGRYAAYVLLSWILGAIGFFVITAFASAITHLAAWALAFGGPDDVIHASFNLDSSAAGVAAVVHTFWLRLVTLLAFSWVYSFFWSTASTIYLLLRHDVDGTAWDDIYRPELEAHTVGHSHVAASGGEGSPQQPAPSAAPQETG